MTYEYINSVKLMENCFLFSIISSLNMNVFTSINFALNHVFLIQSDAEFVFIGYAMSSLSDEDNITSYQGTMMYYNRTDKPICQNSTKIFSIRACETPWTERQCIYIRNTSFRSAIFQKWIFCWIYCICVSLNFWVW